MNIDPMNARPRPPGIVRIWHQNGRQVTIVATNGTTNTNYSRLDLIHGIIDSCLIALGVGRVPEGEPGEVEGCEWDAYPVCPMAPGWPLTSWKRNRRLRRTSCRHIHPYR